MSDPASVRSGLAYRYRPVAFFLATFVVTWAAWLVAFRLQSREGGEATASLFNLVGLLGPMVVGLAMILGSGSPALRRDLVDRIVSLRRIDPRVLVAAVVVPPLVMAISIGLSLVLGESSDQFRLASGSGLAGLVVLALVLAPIIEELGWRGYGVDSLRSRMGMLASAVLFGLVWSLWHAPLVALRGTYHHELAEMPNPLFLANFFVSVVPAAVLANWVYYRNDRSITAGVIVHAALNASAVLPAAGQVAKCIATVLYLVLALVVIRLDRATFRAGPASFLGRSSRPGGAVTAG